VLTTAAAVTPAAGVAAGVDWPRLRRLTRADGGADACGSGCVYGPAQQHSLPPALVQCHQRMPGRSDPPTQAVVLTVGPTVC